MSGARLLWLLLSACRADVLVKPGEESLFTLSPAVDVITFSNYTTNNPLDNLKDFPDTWQPDFDVHEFSLEDLENKTEEDELTGPEDQVAVESHEGHGVTAQPPQDSEGRVSTSASFSESVSIVRVTLPVGPLPTQPPQHQAGLDAFSSLYSGVGADWSDTPEEFLPEGEARKELEELEEVREELQDSQLYDVVVTTGELPKDREVSEEEEMGEDEEYQYRLNHLQEKYGKSFESSRHGHSMPHESMHHEHAVTHEDMKNPLIMLMKIEPHALDLLLRPHTYIKGTMVRLMYERVPRNKAPLLQHLEDPVIEYVPLHWPAQHHRLQDLPMGKYIVCGEAHLGGEILQANCFETVIDRLDNNMLPGGVVGIICFAILSIFLVIVYAIYYRLTRNRRHREKEEKKLSHEEEKA